MQNIIIIISEPLIYHITQKTLFYIGNNNNVIIFYCYFFILNHMLFSLVNKSKTKYINNDLKDFMSALSVCFVYLVINMIAPKINYIVYHLICISILMLFTFLFIT